VGHQWTKNRCSGRESALNLSFQSLPCACELQAVAPYQLTNSDQGITADVWGSNIKLKKNMPLESEQLSISFCEM